MGERRRAEGSALRTGAAAIALLALSAGLYWAWWDSFHELFRFFKEVPGTMAPPFVVGGTGYAHCFTKAIGVAVGALLVLSISAVERRRASTGKDSQRGGLAGRLQGKAAVAIMLVAQIALTAANGFVRTFVENAGLVVCLLYGAATVLFVLLIVRLGLLMRGLSLRRCGAVFVGALATYGLCNNMVFPLLLLNAAIPVISVFYSFVVLLSFLLERYASGLVPVVDEAKGLDQGRAPWRLVAHLAIYGCVFGLIHILEGLIWRGPYSVNIGVFFGALLAASLFCALFMRKDGGKELWSKMQSTVFPLVIIGFVLVPQLSGSYVALALTESGNFLYIGFVVLGCQVFMRRTDVDDRVVMASALLFYSCGEAVGVVLGAVASLTFDVSSLDYTTLTTAVILLLTAATFWVGPSDQVRKLWGLRRNLTPKRYNDLVLMERVRILTRECGLTPREAEVLSFVAQGKRAPEIRDAMGVSIYTARTHLRNLYTKIGAHSYAETVRMLESVAVDESGWQE